MSDKNIDARALRLGALLFTIFVPFVEAVLATLLGAISGWITGLVFEDIILGVIHQLGLHSVTMWQLGGFLGFIGGFFKRHSLKISPKD